MKMKLKNILIIAFLTLTLIPIIFVSVLLYKSGFSLSKESYLRNLTESINVQADYITQTIENNMIADYRFAGQCGELSTAEQKDELLSAFQSYLRLSEDKISVCIWFDQGNLPLYTIGESAMVESVGAQLTQISQSAQQSIAEISLGDGVHSLGIVTPVRDKEQNYLGCLVSVYERNYLFKIISSYYEVADTSTYICRENGDVISFRGMRDETHNVAVEQALAVQELDGEGGIDARVGGRPVSGYYKGIRNTPWYLAGFLDDEKIYSFTNQFVLIYIIIIIAVVIADVILAINFSRRVVEPINGLIRVIEGYENSLDSNDLQYHEKNGYYETKYLRTRFSELMKTILRVQHNFEGVYQLYQSSEMEDTNIDIDVKNQTVQSTKQEFQALMDEIELEEGQCIVSRFIQCFCEKDQVLLTDMLEKMRDEHLSITREAEVRTHFLNEKWFHILVVPMYEDDRLSRLFIQLRDISGFRRQEFQSIEQARRDPLTGLYNRLGLTACVNEAVQSGQEPDLCALLFLDMNDFKLVNDTLGHSAGDDLLCAIAGGLQEAAGSDNVVSRFGGDEFAVFLPHTSAEKIAVVKAEIEKRLVYPFRTEQISFSVTASVGAVMWSQASAEPLDALIKRADAAMYQAKRQHKSGQNK